MIAITIRPYRAADGPGLAALFATWIAECQDRVAGFSDLGEDGHVDMPYVHPDFQRRGVARALLVHVASQARARGLQRLYIEASITARAPHSRRSDFA